MVLLYIGCVTVYKADRDVDETCANCYDPDETSQDSISNMKLLTLVQTSNVNVQPM